MEVSPTSRSAAGLGLIILFALFSHLRLFQRELPRYPGYDDAVVEMTEIRCAPLHGFVPLGATLAYTTDRDPRASLAGQVTLSLTQYALAPAIIDQAARHPLAVGNFTPAAVPLFLQTNTSWKVVTNLGNGILLFQTDAP